MQLSLFEFKEKKQTGRKPIKWVTRECLKCSEDFKSSGPHRRVCDNCKKTDDWKHADEDLKLAL